jgi:hypothetical protein
MGGGTLGLPSSLPSDSLLDNYPDWEVGEGGMTPASAQASSVLGYDPFVRHVMQEITRAEPHFMAQRAKIAEDQKFAEGHQLSSEDLRILRAMKRPDTAINEIQKFIRFAAGIERRTQQALLYNARTIEDQQAALKGELIGKQYEWFCDQSKAQFERSRAFESKLVCGLGIVDIGVSDALDPTGLPRYTYCEPDGFLFPKCSKENWGLDSSSPIKWIGRETFMDVDEAVHKWPDQAMFLRAAAGGAAEDQFPDFGRGAGRPIQYVVPWIMTEPLNVGGGTTTGKPGKCQILEWQEYFDDDGYYFYDPIQRDDTWLNTSDFRKLRRGYRVLYHQDITDYLRKRKRIFKRAFLLQRRILLQEPKPLKTRNVGFTWNVMTGAWDHDEELWFGMQRVFMAPQKYTNALFRQVLEILGASHKGGAFVEVNAMTTAQKRDYEETGAAPGTINLVQPGAISGNRILPKPIPQLP